ncbi:helicase-like protein, partial [Trifolium medium]|nr:helicase-like protein [Trifolium medium]
MKNNNNKCSKFFPKKNQETTIVDNEGFPVYRRRTNGHTILKSGIELDNRYVVPYNPNLLLKYRAHINMEWCNRRTSIKYLFKYIHKGYDRISATVTANNGNQQHEVDEIKQYLDCRYISPNNQEVEQVLEKPSVTESMFTSWLDTNAKYSQARKLTYGELYYLRMMLNVVKGPISYDHIKKVAGVQLKTFREACFEMGFLGDDKEFIEAIREAKDWGSGYLLRLLFVTMLLSAIMDRPSHVWNKSKQWLADGVLFLQRRIANNP